MTMTDPCLSPFSRFAKGFGRVFLLLCMIPGLQAPLALAAKNLNGFLIDEPLVPRGEIFHGGPPRDGIPAINQPKYEASSAVDWLNPEDRLLGLELNGVRRAYPLRILNHHEIVNDELAGHSIVVTYCPLCGTGMIFDAHTDGVKRHFGVSGLVYNSDVLLYDRESESLWSQILGQAISGPEKGTRLKLLVSKNTTWQVWQAGGPSEVLSRDTGHIANYAINPYESYEVTEYLQFPVSAKSRRYHAKERVMGIEINGQRRAYPFAELAKMTSPVSDSLGGEALSIHFDAQARSGEIRDAKGQPLALVNTFWFAWFAFYPETEVFTAGQGDGG